MRLFIYLVLIIAWGFCLPLEAANWGAQRTPRLHLASPLMGRGPVGNACHHHVSMAERAHGIPNNLLQAISKVESGKKDNRGKFVAWPWTVNAEGKGYFYNSKAEAIKAVREMQASGIKSIDVGCMQVNLKHHPTAFRNLDLAFDPAHNVRYAANFLKDLNNQLGDWNKAVAHYHSATPAHHIPYHKKVMAQWNNEKHAPVDLNAQPRSYASLPISRTKSPAIKTAHLRTPGASGNAISRIRRPGVMRVAAVRPQMPRMVQAVKKVRGTRLGMNL